MKNLMTILPKNSGRSKGKVTVRHQGGRNKRFLREIDFKRNKKDVWATVETIEYDPNRNVEIAQILYEDGDRRYILCPSDLKIGNRVISSDVAPIETGNAMILKNIPIGAQIHNLEINPGKGGQMVKAAGTVASVQGKDEKHVLVKLPSGEVRKFVPEAMATIGQLGMIEAKEEILGKAGRKRHMGIRPTVRGVVMHPHAHPHGGGEGRSSVGMKYPKTPWGRPAVGKTRKKKKYSDHLIVQGRKKGSHS